MAENLSTTSDRGGARGDARLLELVRRRADLRRRRDELDRAGKAPEADVSAVGEQIDAITAEDVDLRAELLGTPAGTLEGLVVKARAAYETSLVAEGRRDDRLDAPPDPERFGVFDGPVLVWSLLADLRRLAGER